MFVSMKRQEFRDYFQPTKITIGVLRAENKIGYNLITLCFSMYCSYKPNMVCFSVQNTNHSYKLLDGLESCVLPGLKQAKANIEILVVHKVPTGDHITVFGEVKSFNVNIENNERNLLSVGRNHEGFEILARKGVHRIAAKKRESEC